MFGLGTKELLIIVGILVLLFGSKAIPELGKNLAEAIVNLRKGFKDPSKTDKQE